MRALLYSRSTAIVALVLAVSAVRLSWRSIPVGAQPAAAPTPQQGCGDNLEFYKRTVQPVLRSECYRCHGGMNHRGGLSLDTRAGMMRGGHDGAVIVPYHPEQSLLLRLIRHEGPADDPMPMPPKSKLADGDIASVTRWIACGADMPTDTPQR